MEIPILLIKMGMNHIVTAMFKRWIPADKNAASNITLNIDDNTPA